MNLFASSLACSQDLGSEPQVGFRAIEALAGRFDVDVVTSAGMSPPAGVAGCHTMPVRFDDPNDVSAWQLLQFELRQRRIVRRMLGERKIDVLVRVTPSGWKDSLLPVPGVPVVLGPILLSEPAPEAFGPILRPRMPREFSPRALVRRVQHGVARRVFSRWSTADALLRAARLILVGTRTTLRRLPAELQAKCRWIPYAGVEHDVYHPPRRPRANRVPQLLFVGRLVPYKGIELLLRSAAAAVQSCEFKLKIVGGGNEAYRRYCQNLVQELRLGDRVEFALHQPRETLPELYRAADVFCMPSVETYGLAILEAMSSGCAVLASDINGPGEIVQPGTGVKIGLETPEQFIAEYAEQIVRLVEDTRLRTELGASAREHVVQHHDWRKIQLELVSIFEDAFSGSAVAGSGLPYRATLAATA